MLEQTLESRSWARQNETSLEGVFLEGPAEHRNLGDMHPPRRSLHLLKRAVLSAKVGTDYEDLERSYTRLHFTSPCEVWLEILWHLLGMLDPTATVHGTENATS